MKNYIIENEFVTTGVSEDCGFLHPVRFNVEGKIIEPLNFAPWNDEILNDETPPMLKGLRGDFFCLPFGASDVLKEEPRPHGSTANGKWRLFKRDEARIEMILPQKVSGAEIKKIISLIPGSPLIYQEHRISGGEGRIPFGHHLMLKVPEKIYLSFSEFLFGETPPFPVETDPELGFSLLKYPQRFSDLKKALTKNDQQIDMSRFPIYQDHEDLVMLKSDESQPFAWSAASAPRHGWLWFALKNPRVLNSTVLWLSDGGRKYSPFSGRHRKVIGIEEVTSYFHLGHKASAQENHLTQEGYRTSLELSGEKTHSIRYAFGVIKIPREFTYVRSVEEIENGILVTDINGIKVEIKADLNFINNN